MAGYKYYTILTDIGKEKLVEAIANETALDFTEIAVGDSNGTSYNPTPDMTALKHETYRATISSVSIDEVDKNIMIFEMVVPASSGGYYIREAGLFSSDGSLIAIARTAEQYKPLLEEGAGASITISMRIAISSDAQVYINIPESINYATQNFVQEEFKKHKADENPHTQYVILNAYNEKIYELEQALSSKADSNHNHDSVYLKKTDASSTYATKSEMNTGLAGKAASNHNHDSVYAKIGNAVLSDGSVKSNHIAENAITATHLAANSVGESELGYTPAKRTNMITATELFTRAGVSGQITTAALVAGISQNINNFRGLTVVHWVRPAQVSDLPADHLTITIQAIDQNGIFMEARPPYGDNSLWIGSTYDGAWGGWKQIRYSDGHSNILAFSVGGENSHPICVNTGFMVYKDGGVYVLSINDGSGYSTIEIPIGKSVTL